MPLSGVSREFYMDKVHVPHKTQSTVHAFFPHILENKSANTSKTMIGNNQPISIEDKEKGEEGFIKTASYNFSK